MARIDIVRDYPHPPAVVWRAVTDPELVPYWTATGKGARPVGFVPEVGNRFQFVAAPTVGWNGVVDCVVVAVEEPVLLHYTWRGGANEAPTDVRYRLAPHAGATRFTYEHTGFTGIGGLVMATVLGRVRRKMLTVGLPALLDELDEDSSLTPEGAERLRRSTGRVSR